MASSFDNSVAPSTCDQCGNPAEDIVQCSVRDNKNLCRPCFRDLPGREDIGEPEWVCDIHATRKVDFFCERCKIGCCKECAGDVHNDHKVVDVVKLTVEIRQKLQAQLEEVNTSAEVLSELRNKVNDTMNKIKEAPMVVEKVVREIKEEVQSNLDEEIHRIIAEAHEKLKNRKEKADCAIQRILAIRHDIYTDPYMLGKVAEWSNKMEKTESTLLEREQACESANEEIKSMFDACPEKVIRRGRQLSSLVKTSSALRNGHMDIIATCKAAVKAEIPEFKMEKDIFFHINSFFIFEPFLVYLRIALTLCLVFDSAWVARENYINEYNQTLLSSESMSSLSSLIWSCLSFPKYNFLNFFLLVAVFVPYSLDYPIKIKFGKLHVCRVILRMILEFWLLTTLFVFIVSSPIYIFQVKNVSKDVLFVMSVLQSCLCIYSIHYSTSFKTFYSYTKGTKFEDYRSAYLFMYIMYATYKTFLIDYVR